MDLQDFSDFSKDDPTWERALEIVRGKLQVPPQFSQLIRGCWSGNISYPEFSRVITFSRVNLSSLFDAAEMLSADEAPKAADLERAVTFLGLRYACVVLAVNYSVSVMLGSHPPRYWRNLVKEMMTDIEVGYRLGTKSANIGLENGMVMGFVKGAGLGLLMALDSKKFTSWYSKTNGFQDKEFLIENFGCEPYQVAALAIQQLGFGTEMATGAALAMGGLSSRHLELTPEIKNWHAAYLWIQALRDGRSYPGPIDARNHFSEIAPPKDKTGRNVGLEVLYTEIAKTRRGSEWTWHLPKPCYDASAEALDLR